MQRHDFSAVHLFNFGSYVPGHDKENNSDPLTCELCIAQITNDRLLTHLYNECEVSKYFWNKLGSPRPMSLEEMVAPVDTSFENLKRLNRFFKIVKRTYAIRQAMPQRGDILLQYPTNRELNRFMAVVVPMKQSSEFTPTP